MEVLHLIPPTEILGNAPELYHMDVDSDFIESSHESREVDSAWPNNVAGLSQITVSLPNKHLKQEMIRQLSKAFKRFLDK